MCPISDLLRHVLSLDTEAISFSSLSRKVLSDVDALRAKKSNAGALLDDEEEVKMRRTEVRPTNSLRE